MSTKLNAAHKCVACLCMMGAPIVGCSDGFASPQAHSTELDFVLANSEDFVAPEDNPLANDDPGVVRDELSNLEGCWGAYFGTPGGSELGYVKVIDSQDQRIESHLYSKGVTPFDVLLVSAGSYSIADEDRIIASWDTVTSSDILTGLLIAVPAEDYYAETTEELLLTLSGEYLRQYPVNDMLIPPGIDFSFSLVFTKFECP